MLRALEGRPRAAGLLAWLRLVRVFQRVDRASTEQLRCRLSLARPSWTCSPESARTKASRQQRLADALLVTKGNICQLLDKMQASYLAGAAP